MCGLNIQIDPDRLREAAEKKWWKNEVITDHLDRWAADRPDLVAIISHEAISNDVETISYRQLARLADRVAWGLIDLGVEAGDTVSVQLPNWWHFTVIYLACARIGAVINPITPIMRHREVTFMLERTRAKAMIIPESFRGFRYADMMTEVAPSLPDLKATFVVGDPASARQRSFNDYFLHNRREIKRSATELQSLRPDPNALAEVIFTSGTTGEPKGVMHTHNTLRHCIEVLEHVIRPSERDVVLMPSTFGHQTGFLFGVNFPIVVGLKAVYQDVWEANAAIRLIAEEGVTMTVSATPFLMDLIRAPAARDYDHSSFRYFLCGGAPIPSALVQEAENDFGCRVLSLWGMSENGAVTLVYPDDPPGKSAESDGRVVPNMEIKIVHPQTHEGLPPRQEGLLVSRGASQFVGYLNRPDLTEASHLPGGWFDTGDLAWLSEDGYLRISGRAKDIIIRGGENIPVIEIENALYR
ncbi:MAG TPA: AMP-binding protein, partial [Dehalococcoidia bacterium]|nr:AMP-binding protein [Dehalococcoidia bacterium]